MELTSADAAAQLGVSQRQVQRLAQNGRIINRSMAGRTILSGRSLLAASRSMARGRRWDERTVVAACELLERGETEQISGSQRSRLRARLRTCSAAELAYQVLSGRATLWRRTGSTPNSDDLSVDAFSAGGNRLHVTVTHDARDLARRERLVGDSDGDLILIELDTDALAIVEDIALYAYGDERESSAAQQRLVAHQRASS